MIDGNRDLYGRPAMTNDRAVADRLLKEMNGYGGGANLELVVIKLEALARRLAEIEESASDEVDAALEQLGRHEGGAFHALEEIPLDDLFLDGAEELCLDEEDHIDGLIENLEPGGEHAQANDVPGRIPARIVQPISVPQH